MKCRPRKRMMTCTNRSNTCLSTPFVSLSLFIIGFAGGKMPFPTSPQHSPQAHSRLWSAATRIATMQGLFCPPSCPADTSSRAGFPRQKVNPNSTDMIRHRNMDPSSQQDISHPQQAKKPVHHNSKSAINQLNPF